MAQPQPQVDLRRAPRFVIELPAWLRASGRSRARVRVVDLSTHGCRIDDGWGLILDSTVWLTLGRLQAVEARVVWAHCSFAGLEFASPLNDAVLEWLLAGGEASEGPAPDDLRAVSARCDVLAASAFREDTAAELVRLAQDCRAAADAREAGSGDARP